MSLTAREPGGVVSKTAAKPAPAEAMATDQLQRERNIVMGLCGARARRSPVPSGLEGGAVDANQVLEGQSCAGDGAGARLEVGLAQAVGGQVVRELEPGDQRGDGVGGAAGGLVCGHLA